MSTAPIYLDYNATTPLAPEVAEAMQPFLTGVFGNPSSDHAYGAEAKRALERARAQVAEAIGARPEDVVFTGGGTESNNIAIKGIAQASPRRGHIVYSAIEHPAVTEVVRFLDDQGFRTSVVGVDSAGQVNPDDVAAAIEDDTVLVSIMLANNEVGSIQAIRLIADIAHARGAYVHTDAAQAVGKIAVDVEDLQVDALSIAGHKLYAPKGVGALYLRTGIRLTKQTHGASHEHGVRPGTENVMFAVALGRACQAAGTLVLQEMPRISVLRDRFEETIIERLGSHRARVNAKASVRLPNTSSISFRGVEANTLLAEIGGRVAASAGAACHADSIDISTVLRAMAIPEDWAMGTIRFSMGVHTTEKELQEAADIVCGAVEKMVGGVRAASQEPPVDHKVQLTRFTQGMGCACKIRPQLLEKILSDLPLRPDPNVIVSTTTSDDAGVYRLSDEVALVQTADFFTPIVNDPYSFGAVAAANALSDIYAMGAKPLYALNIVGFPSQRLPGEVLRQILRGAADKCAEADISIIGGHTVEDTEPKFGLAVTGVVHPSKVLLNSGAKPGDALVLTKPLGTGIIATGIKRGLGEAGEEDLIIDLMAQLNRKALEAMEGLTVHACTDVTGFGLLGHLHEMTAASGVDAEISVSRVPVLQPARRLASAEVVSGGTVDNLRYVESFVEFDDRLPQSVKWIMADAQTSGGLLISIRASDTPMLLERLRRAGIEEASEIGRMTTKGRGAILLRH